MRRSTSPWLLFSFNISLTGFILLHYFLGRWSESSIPGLPTDGIFPVFLLLFLLFFLQYKLIRDEEQERWGFAFSIIARAALIFCLPNLSDDFYRFVWDGHLAGNGGLLERWPSEWMGEKWMGENGPPWGKSKEFWEMVYEGLNSKEYATVYPPALQVVFRASAAIAGENLLGMIIVMKVAIFGAEVGSLVLLRKLLRKWKRPTKWALLYGLNPLVISEMVGNVHFEAFMLCFTLLGLWWLVQSPEGPRYLLASIPFALAICAKLLPVLFFPFLIRRLGWGRSILLGLLTGALTVGFFVLVFDMENFGNFLDSVRLYFRKFEFNANLYYIARWALGDQGFRVSQILPYVTMGLILLAAWRQKASSWASLPLQLLMALSIYQILQPVIHPWYIAPLIGLAALTRYRFPVWWSVFLPLTYLTYFNPDFEQPWWALWLEYSVLFLVIFFEWQFEAGKKTLEDWVREKPFLKRALKKSIPARMAIKLDRIDRHLNKGESILDLGTGNGGLCLELRNRGHHVQPVDVKNISFFESVTPLIYDGQELPYPDDYFDTVLLITVLHHTPDPAAVFDEGLRVARKRIIVMEDIYKNPFQKHLTFFTDSLVNLEFVGHPHTNMTDEEWQALFADQGLNLVAKDEFPTLIFFRQVIYVLEK